MVASALILIYKSCAYLRRCEGVLAGTLEGVVFWEKKLEKFIPHGLVTLDGSCTSVTFEPLTRHCLASFRPSKRHPHCRHIVSVLIVMGTPWRNPTCNKWKRPIEKA